MRNNNSYGIGIHKLCHFLVMNHVMNLTKIQQILVILSDKIDQDDSIKKDFNKNMK